MLAERLKQLRKEAGLTQKQVAEFLQVAQNSYSNWEKGIRTPLNPTIDKLAELFQVSSEFLKGNTEDRNIDTSSQPEIFFRKAVSDMNMTPEQEKQFQKDVINFIEQRKRIFEEDK
ncbi:helix-turn-helix domain-containing protein [Streptococcus gallolyticus]|nr:helix-turn-helix domain-containing protein [Streptococcus gallolyticus]MBY5040704.1 helix-turn-helix domain-containing protein [Streptococcus gallolyticus]